MLLINLAWDLEDSPHFDDQPMESESGMTAFDSTWFAWAMQQTTAKSCRRAATVGSTFAVLLDVSLLLLSSANHNSYSEEDQDKRSSFIEFEQ